MQVENDSSPSNLTPPARTPVGLFLFCGLWYDTNKAFPQGGRCPEGADEGGLPAANREWVAAADRPLIRPFHGQLPPKGKPLT